MLDFEIIRVIKYNHLDFYAVNSEESFGITVSRLITVVLLTVLICVTSVSIEP